MAKEAGKKSFLDFFKMKDLDDDEFDDDLFDDDDDDDDDDDYYSSKSTKKGGSKTASSEKPTATSQPKQTSYSGSQSNALYKAQQSTSAYAAAKQAQASRPTASNNKLVEFNSNSRQRSESYRGRSEVYVIKPQEINEAQTVTDFLRNGKTIVINMEGVELAPAQRIIDFIGGACYALNGTLQAISANIFIAAPDNIEVTGDLREEILNESTVSPQLGRY
ncbi:MAG: cell division protein SepF [Clostridium sp.]|nr:cell division protein SepF [Clostridium sp.]MCM1398819.1 cell division protein SepF [Clostridium sp.]MCM1458549.1 cell division protein SepF [Bacteroides sp.]